jgi:hypothetical protein
MAEQVVLREECLVAVMDELFGLDPEESPLLPAFLSNRLFN